MTLRDDAYNRANSRCECAVRDCGHNGRCSAPLGGEWGIRRLDPSRPFGLDNVVAMCDACFRHALGSLPGF
jgi:hypothetical protein